MQVRAEGQYINDKIDLLIQYLLVDPFKKLYTRIFKHKVRSTIIITCCRNARLGLSPHCCCKCACMYVSLVDNFLLQYSVLVAHTGIFFWVI